MVKRRNGDSAGQRLTGGEDLARFALGGHVGREDLAVIPQCFHGSEPQDIQGAPNFIASFAQCEPRFTRDCSGKLFAPAFECGPCLLENLRTLIAAWSLSKGASFR